MPAEVFVREDTPTPSFAEYVAACGPSLRRFAYLLTGDRAECADLVQEALAGAWPRWEALVAKGSHDAYLRRSIANGAVSRWRKLHRLVPVAEPQSGGLQPGPDAADAEVAWQLCAELPPLQRAAVVLRFYEDLSYADIANVLNCAEPTARSHVRRALITLRERLTNGADDE